MPRAKRNTYPNKAAFKEVMADLATGNELTFHHCGMVFGPDFYELLIYAFLDANDAARAIQGAIGRLRAGGKSDAAEKCNASDTSS